MYMFLPRLFILALLLLGFGAAQAQTQTVYGLEFNKPLNFPECKEKKAHFPKVVCYVQGDLTEAAVGSVRSARIYFPKNKSPVGSVDNTLDVDLLDGKLVDMRVRTAGLKDQAQVIDMLTKRFGQVKDQWVVNTDDDLDLIRGAIFSRWEAQGLVVRLFGSMRKENGQGAIYITDPQYMQAMDLFIGRTPMTNVAGGGMQFYGIALNKPLSLPKCKEMAAHYPQEVCYVDISESEATLIFFGALNSVKVYFPKYHMPEVALSNSLYLALLDGRVVGLAVMTPAVNTQAYIFDFLSAKFGKPYQSKGSGTNKVNGGMKNIEGSWTYKDLFVQYWGILDDTDFGILYIVTMEAGSLMMNGADMGGTPM